MGKSTRTKKDLEFSKVEVKSLYDFVKVGMALSTDRANGLISATENKDIRENISRISLAAIEMAVRLKISNQEGVVPFLNNLTDDILRTKISSKFTLEDFQAHENIPESAAKIKLNLLQEQGLVIYNENDDTYQLDGASS